MSISYEEALATLQAMFAEPWTRESLDTVLRHFQGHMENTVDSILSHGDKPPQELLDRLKSGAPAQDTALDEQLARQLSQGQTRQQAAPTTSGGGSDAAAAATQPAAKKGRGTPTTLPDDFLRIPGRTPTSDSAGTATGGATTSTGQSTLDADEALARMLQDELFSEELARNPDFAHLAGRRPANNGQHRQPTAGGATAHRSGMWPTGFPAANGSGQQMPPMPNIMEKLSGKVGQNMNELFFVSVLRS